MTNPNDPAGCPTWVALGHNDGISGLGLTKREYFASMALSGMIVWDSKMNDAKYAGDKEQIAIASVSLADALIAELNK